MDRGVALLPDAGPLITLAYADALDLLLKPGWSVELVDMVFKEVTRNKTPTSERIAAWVGENKLPVLATRVLDRYSETSSEGSPARKSNLGEIAIQETMNSFALHIPPPEPASSYSKITKSHALVFCFPTPAAKYRLAPF